MKPLRRIDFDDEEFCKEHKDELVQIDLGTLRSLLHQYAPGHETGMTYNERLKDAQTYEY